jgi:prepilin-type N-terminal cleavage/methylation domain-containing protein/prepilin-type processing-associated H-X9-DG protein
MQRTIRWPARAGFTLIELLVVIAIIAILAAILFPVFAQAKAEAKQTQCLAQVHEIGLATLMYSTDFDDLYPPLMSFEAPINGGERWNRPYDTMISPYVRNDSVFRCPTDLSAWPGLPLSIWWDGSYWAKREKRSYVILGNIYTVQGGLDAPDPNTGISIGVDVADSVGRASSQFDAPADTLAFTEAFLNLQQFPDSWLGEASGSGFADCDAGKLPGRAYPSNAPADQLPCPASYDYSFQPHAFHTAGENFAFVDGHSKLMTFYKVRHDDFFLFKAAKPTETFVP